MKRHTSNTLVRLSIDEELSEEFRRWCRIELGDIPRPSEPDWFSRYFPISRALGL